MTDREKLYRYELVRYSLGVDEYDNPLPGYKLKLSCQEYVIVRRTPKGAWINCDYSFRPERFVLLTARKKFAAETKEQALESFRARKEKQKRILTLTLNDIELALKGTESFPADDHITLGIVR